MTAAWASSGVEALQILRAITVPGYGWRHHPAVAQWRGYEEALAAYGVAICREWSRRGRADTGDLKIRAEVAGLGVVEVRGQAELDRAGRLPPWLGDDDYHRSHRASLLRKDPDWYGPMFPDVPPDLPYVWPTKRPTASEAVEDSSTPGPEGFSDATGRPGDVAQMARAPALQAGGLI